MHIELREVFVAGATGRLHQRSTNARGNITDSDDRHPDFTEQRTLRDLSLMLTPPGIPA
jgi:hypothetical protein